MRSESRKRLEEVGRLKPGEGLLDVYAFGSGTMTWGSAGAGVDYDHRISDRLSLFGDGRIGYEYGTGRGAYGEARAGLRLRF